MLVLILMCCYCSHENSPCHEICTDETRKPHKIIRELKIEEEPKAQGYDTLEED
jgi:hypothetical protein